MLKITEKYYLETDKYNWTLWEKHIVTEKEAEKSKNNNAGDEIYRNPTFHSSLTNLLIYLLERKQKDVANVSKDIKDLTENLKEMQQSFINDLKIILEENKNEI